MKLGIKIIFGLLFTLFIMSCDKKEESLTCDAQLITEKEPNATYPFGDITIISAVVTDECLEIEYGSSGCDGMSWVVKLIDANKIDGLSNPQTTLRLSLDNKELCEAYFTKKTSFDISELHASGTNTIPFILIDYDKLLEYNY